MKVKSKLIKSVALIITVFIFALYSFSLNLKRDKHNLIDYRIFGKWRFSDKVNTILRSSNNIGKIEFTNEPGIINKIPAKFNKHLKNKRIYAAGIMIFKNKNYPFILINYSGNMNVVFFRPRNGHPLGDAESFIVTLVRGNKKANDILFIGGDFVGEALSPFTRAN